MPRWFTLTEDHLKAAGHGAIVEQARLQAGEDPAIDPVDEAIAAATTRIQRAIATGNILDADPTKIPDSFRGVAAKLALYNLMEFIGAALSPDQTATMRDITSDLNRTADNKLKVEMPDDPASTGTMQPTGLKVSAVNVPPRLTGRGRTSGL